MGDAARRPDGDTSHAESPNPTGARARSLTGNEVMLDTLMLLIVGHLVGDFVLQTGGMVKRKRNVWVLLGHVALVTAACAVMLGGLPVVVLVVLFISHLAIDAAKVHLASDRPAWFVVDQALHLGVMVFLAWVDPRAAERVGWIGRLSPEQVELCRVAVVYLGGVVLCVPTGAAVVRVFVSPLTDQLHDKLLEGLASGGKYIGWLERGLIFLMVIMRMPEGIGFLFAAKSIFRFNDLKDPGQRKFAEYVIIGTFLSFGWALLAAHLTQELLAGWAR